MKQVLALGTVFSDTLLWRAAAPEHLGQTSGFGAAFGYLGSALGLLMIGLWLLHRVPY